MKRIIAGIAALAGGWGLMAGSAGASERARLEVAEPWSNVFGGREAVFHVRTEARKAVSGRLVWRFALGAATLARGDAAIEASPGVAVRTAVRVALPMPGDGTVAACALEAALMGESGQTLASVSRTVHVYPENPFAGRTEWLKGLNVRLFDPGRRTRAVFESAGIPHALTANADAVADGEYGVLVLGEGVSFREYRGLGRVILDAAGRGRRVLVLAPAGGGFPLPEAARIELRRADAIRALDKRLDADAWPPEGRTRAAAVRLTGERSGAVNIEAADAGDPGGGGWPWCSIEFDGGGRIVIYGFAFADGWEAGPAPRYLFARVLEFMVEPKREEGGVR